MLRNPEWASYARGPLARWRSTLLWAFLLPAALLPCGNIASAAGARVVGWGSNNYGESTIPADATNIIAIAAGSAHSLALSEDGRLLAWGGGGTVPPAGVSNLVTIAAGGFHSMGLRPDGTVWVWSPQADVVNVPATATNVIKMSAGNIHVMVLRADGQVVAWGDNAWGQTNVPADVTNVVDIAAGGIHAMAVRRDGVLRVWGQITRVPAAATNVVAVGATFDHCLALRNDGTVVEWNQNHDYPTPAGLSNVVAISNGGALHWVALRADGTVVAWCWTSSIATNVPAGLNHVSAIAAGGEHNLALADDSGLRIHTQPQPVTALAGDSAVFSCEARGAIPLAYHWSQDGNPIPDALRPFLILTNVQASSAGVYQVLVTNSTGSITSQLAPLTVIASVPRMQLSPLSLVLLPGASASLQAAARGSEPMGFHWQKDQTDLADAAGLSLDLNSVGWSDTGSYRLVGTNSAGTAASDPVWVSVVQAASWGGASPAQTNVPAAATNLVAIACGDAHTLALRADGGLQAWGDNGSGQCTIPAVASNVVSIAAGSGLSLASLSNGQCLAWGNNAYSRTSIPSAATNVVAVSAGSYHCLALRQDGTLIGWGYNSDGETTVPQAATNVVALACGAYHSLALRDDGTIVAWGRTNSGQVTVPAQATNIVALAGGLGHSLALDAHGRVLAWGDNTSGQCDVPPGLSNAVAIAANGNFSLGLRKDGVVIGWGDTSANQAVVPPLVTNVDAIAAGAGFNSVLLDDGAFHWRAPLPSVAAPAGDAVVLLPRFFGKYPDSYQWLLDGSPVPGATNAWLVLRDAQQLAGGSYAVVLTSGSGSLTGLVATVTVTPRAPGITSQPTSQLVVPNYSASLTVSAKGTEPMTYQWRHEGINLATATSTRLVLANIQWKDLGSYDVVVSNAVGTTLSSPATLTFDPTVDAFDLGVDNHVYALAPQPDGKVLLGGAFTIVSTLARANLARLNPDGTLDLAFAPSAGGFNSYVVSCAVQPDGKILAGGHFTTMCGQARTNIARLNPDGSLDPSFSPQAGGTSVYCLALQPDGKILLGGAFTNLAGQPRTNIARLQADGTLDTTFNPGANGTVYALAVQPDGKILVGGTFTTLAGQARSRIGRLDAGGILDTNFNPGASATVLSLVVQPDGRILVGGGFTTLAGQTRNYIGRLQADGTLDTAFNPGANGQVDCLALQADGKILAGGLFASLGGQPRSCVGRLGADGASDPTFNPGANGTVLSLALGADGRVLAGGSFTTFASQQRTRIARVPNPDAASHSLQVTATNITWLRAGASPEAWRAAFDVSTNGTGWLSLGPASRVPGGWELNGLTLPPEATVRARGWLTAGYGNASAGFVEDSVGPPAISIQPASQTNRWATWVTFSVLAAGSPPSTYQWRKDGVDLNDTPYIHGTHAPWLTMATVSGGDCGGYSVIISNSYGSVTSVVATLLVPDPWFALQPVSQVTNAGRTLVLRANAAGTQPIRYQWRKDGVPLAGATSTSLTFASFQLSDGGLYDLVATNIYGSVTSTGAIVGLISTADTFNPGASGGSGASTYLAVYALAPQPDGKVVVAGDFTTLGGQTRNYLGRLNADGTLDRNFDPGADSWTFALVIQPDSRIVVGGWSGSLGGQPRNFLGRVGPDGVVEPGFNPAPSGGASFPGVYALALQPDGKMIVGGGMNRLGGPSCTNIGRLNADGSRDTNFNASADEVVYTAALQSDGKIVIGGNFGYVCGQARSRIARLNPNGSLDTSFNPGANDIPLALVVQPNGKILAGGPFTTLGGQTCNRIGRLNPDGSLDLTFLGSANASVRCLALQADGRILLGGDFTTLGTQSRSHLGRLNADGSTDTLFTPSAGATVFGLTLQPDGRILAGGCFHTLGGQSRSEIGRLTNTYPALQSLTLAGSTLTWSRGGASPEVWRVAFDASTNGADWFGLGAATRIAGGWQATNVTLPASATIRARGAVASGRYNASVWFTDTSIGPPAVSIQPADRTNSFATNATFSVLAAGTPPLGYQWLKDGVPLNEASRVVGAYTTTLTLSNVSGADNGGYSVVITNALGSVTSRVAALTVSDPFVITQPIGCTNTAGQTASFHVAAGGTAPFGYQWRKDGAPLADATASSLTLTNLRCADAGSYDVVVTNSFSSVTSVAARLWVNPSAGAVVLSNLTRIYDGTPKTVSVSTQPPGLDVNVTYNGSASAPTNPGSYTVIAAITDPCYPGSATNTLLISVPLVAPGWDRSGQFQFSVLTAVGMEYTVQISADLKTWVSVLAFRGWGGEAIILDPDAASGPQRFYRVRIRP